MCPHVEVTWSWNGRQLKTAIQLRSNFVPIGPSFGLPLPDLDRDGRGLGAADDPRPSADRPPCWACGAPTPRTRRCKPSPCEEAGDHGAGPVSWWPDRHLRTPVSASATAATARPPAYRAPLRVAAARRIPQPVSERNEVGADRPILERIRSDFGTELERPRVGWPPEIATCRCCQTELPVRKAHPGCQQGSLRKENELALQAEVEPGQSTEGTNREGGPCQRHQSTSQRELQRKETRSPSNDSQRFRPI